MKDAMTPDHHNTHATRSGFTLVEALLAMALMGVVMTALGTITAQWLPNWKQGLARAQRAELVNVALSRLIADIGAAQFIAPNRDTRAPLFEGTEASVIFVRSALGPNSQPGLEIVRIAETGDKNEAVLVRSTIAFAPFWPNRTPLGELHFVNPVVLFREPYRISFAYAGRDRIWKSAWRNAQQLPAAIRLTFRDAASERILSISTTARVRVDMPAACVGRKDNGRCAARSGVTNQPTPEGERSAI